MMNLSISRVALFSFALVAGIGVTGCVSVTSNSSDAHDHALTGAWRGHVQFTTGAFAEVKDLEFMYVFNAGGTMTESSNYDAMPPVPPAYGVWKQTGERQYEAKFAYYWTKPPADVAEIAKGGGWSPGGHGVLTQKITLAADGTSFESTITFEMFDQQGKATEAASTANATGVRIAF